MIPTLSEHAVITLWQLVNTSLSAYAKLITQFHTAENTLSQPLSAWQNLNLHASHLERFGDYIKDGRHSAFLTTTLQQIQNGEYNVITYDDSRYPTMLKAIFDPPPLLFFRGNLQALSMPQLAIVGSRKPTPHAHKIAFDMAQFLAYEGMWVTSGLAEGIDKQAHLGALTQTDPSKQGRTVAVFGTGIRQCYPRQHEPILQQIIQSGGCVVSELLPDSPPNKQAFPRRNRLVAGLSLGTLVVEAALKSGSLITATQTNEQGKQVFAIPSHIDNELARGCHQLIREGATLIDHPAQILEDLAVLKSPTALKVESKSKPKDSPKVELNVPPETVAKTPKDKNISNNSMAEKSLQNFGLTASENPPAAFNQTQSSAIPEHLFSLYNQLDWVGQDVDSLVIKTGLNVGMLLGQMMELELMGKAMQHGGLYMRCRS